MVFFLFIWLFIRPYLRVFKPKNGHNAHTILQKLGKVVKSNSMSLITSVSSQTIPLSATKYRPISDFTDSAGTESLIRTQKSDSIVFRPQVVGHNQNENPTDYKSLRQTEQGSSIFAIIDQRLSAQLTRTKVLVKNSHAFSESLSRLSSRFSARSFQPIYFLSKRYQSDGPIRTWISLNLILT